MDYEKNDNQESIDDVVKALMINIGSSSHFSLDTKNLNTDTFLTSFGTIYLAQTMLTDLTNGLFNHSITGSNLVLQHHKSDPFTYINSKRYTSDKLYSIMIDIVAFKQSTAGYGQYFTYKKDLTPIPVNRKKLEPLTFNLVLALPPLLDHSYLIYLLTLLSFILLKLIPLICYAMKTWISSMSISTTLKIY